MKSSKIVLMGVAITFAAMFLSPWGHLDGREGKAFGITSEANAAESPAKLSPVKARARNVYYPNSEDLGPDEMRVIACGTGMPTTRAKQAAACSSSNLATATSLSSTSALGRLNAFHPYKFPTITSTRFSLDTCMRTISVRWLKFLSAGHLWGGRNRSGLGTERSRTRTRNNVCRPKDEGNVYVGPCRSCGFGRLSWLLD